MANYSYSWEEFIQELGSLTLGMQILAILGLILLLVMIGTLIYYIIKGVCYLVYYLLKGVFLLIKGIVVGFYRICEALYYIISGKSKTKKPIPPYNPSSSQEISTTPIKTKTSGSEILKGAPKKAGSFCPYCGAPFSKRMFDRLSSEQKVFCPNCGTGYMQNIVEAVQ